VQGRRREAWSERSMEQKHEPMDKNRIAGKPCWTSGQMITKSNFIKSELTNLPREICRLPWNHG
jgi:hypothetical protein